MENKKPRIAIICRGGLVRSVTLGYVLKFHYGLDVLCLGWEVNSSETMDMVLQWADRILVVEAKILQIVPGKYRTKTFAYAIGEDRWGMSLHPALIEKCVGLVEQDEYFKPYKLLSDGETDPIIKYTEQALESVNKKELSMSLGTLFSGMTAQDLWNTLSKEDKYAVKMMMYREKILHDLSEFVDPSIRIGDTIK